MLVGVLSALITVGCDQLPDPVKVPFECASGADDSEMNRPGFFGGYLV